MDKPTVVDLPTNDQPSTDVENSAPDAEVLPESAGTLGTPRYVAFKKSQ